MDIYIRKNAYTIFLLFFLSTPLLCKRISAARARWWTLGVEYDKPSNLLQSNVITPGGKPYEMYHGLLHLNKKQQHLIKNNAGTLDSVSRGAHMAIKECQHQFSNRRWNCSVKHSEIKLTVFGKILDIGCRETGFIYAITAAAVTHSVAWDCSRGRIQTCTCDYKRQEQAGSDWSWGGCSDNIGFGHKFSKKFTDSLERGKDLRYMVNKQNNEAGRKHVVSERTQQCKCHGMSGSCAMKTCWERLPDFRIIGSKLKERFDGASKVYAAANGWSIQENKYSGSPVPNVKKKEKNSDYNRMIPNDQSNRDLFKNDENSQTRSSTFNFVTVDESHKKPTKKDIVYFEDSPDFCEPDDRQQLSEGTSGRLCNATSIGIDGCDLMCCARGYRTEKYIAKERCSCTFKWCCEVVCKVCTEERTRHICN